MPLKKLADENANARRNRRADSGKTQFNVVAFDRSANDDEKKKRKTLLYGNGNELGNASQERFFAREIKNIIGTPQTDRNPASEAFSRIAEADTFSQLMSDFDTMNLRSDLPSQAQEPAIPSKTRVMNIDACFQPSTLFTHEAFSSSSSGACSVCKKGGKLVPQSGYESDGGDRLYSKMLSGSCRCKRASGSKHSINTSNVMKRSSFRSASIISQSTPLLGKTARRSIRPFKPLEDESDLYPQFSANQEAGESPTTWMAAETCTEGQNHHDGADGSSGALMTQLASQLSEVILSPCIDPLVLDGFSQSSDEDSARSSQETGPPPTRSKNRVDSFSLGFIPTAFPEEIDIRDLRVIL